MARWWAKRAKWTARGQPKARSQTLGDSLSWACLCVETGPNANYSMATIRAERLVRKPQFSWAIVGVGGSAEGQRGAKTTCSARRLCLEFAVCMKEQDWLFDTNSKAAESCQAQRPCNVRPQRQSAAACERRLSIAAHGRAQVSAGLQVHMTQLVCLDCVRAFLPPQTVSNCNCNLNCNCN